MENIESIKQGAAGQRGKRRVEGLLYYMLLRDLFQYSKQHK